MKRQCVPDAIPARMQRSLMRGRVSLRRAAAVSGLSSAALAAVIASVAALAALTASAAALDETAAVNQLQQQLKQHAAYRAHGDCLSFLVEENEAAYIGVAVLEKHGDGCPGDPATAPVVDRFRVDTASGALRRYDVVDDRYAEWPADTLR